MTAAADKVTTGQKMMRGTGGAYDYLVIARRGDIALGIKPNSIMNGKAFGHPGTVWFGTRLRSASAQGMFEEVEESKVVKLEKKPENFWDAWPNVVWELQDNMRASTTIGVLLRGSLDGTRTEAEALLAEMKDGKLSSKMADYLYEIIGPEHMILSPAEIAKWLTENVYGKVAGQIEKSLKAKMIVEKEMEANIGHFGMQAAILKKAYEEVQAESEDPDAADDLDEEEFDDDPDDHD
ncbi:MAG: hypothetical protein KJZ83_00270 [Burkholderiaceae bacterium]|nr:hypothetical protein [Burkholderiaceae bacterium]